MSKVLCLKKYVTEFGENVFSIDGDVLFCKICETKVNGNKRFTVTALNLTNENTIHIISKQSVQKN